MTGVSHVKRGLESKLSFIGMRGAGSFIAPRFVLNDTRLLELPVEGAVQFDFLTVFVADLTDGEIDAGLRVVCYG